MLEPLNVYRHDDGHYLLAPGPAVETVRGSRVAWLGVVEMDSLEPLLRDSVREQLERDACAKVTAAQFYAPARLLSAQH